MTPADEARLRQYAMQAATGETEVERKLAASILLTTAIRALRKAAFLESRPRLSVVKDYEPNGKAP